MKNIKDPSKVIDKFVEEIISQLEMPPYLKGVQTEKQFKDRARMRVHDGCVDCVHMIERGYKNLMDQMVKSKEKIDSYTLTPEKLKKIQDSPALRKKVQEGKMFQELMGYTNEQMIRLYEAASELFEERRFSDASDAFFFLATLNPTITSYWVALGVSLEQMARTVEAYQVYRVAIAINVLNLDLWTRAFACCIRADHIQEKEELLTIANKVIEKLEQDHEEPEFCKDLKEILKQVH